MYNNRVYYQLLCLILLTFYNVNLILLSYLSEIIFFYQILTNVTIHQLLNHVLTVASTLWDPTFAKAVNKTTKPKTKIQPFLLPPIMWRAGRSFHPPLDFTSATVEEPLLFEGRQKAADLE